MSHNAVQGLNAVVTFLQNFKSVSVQTEGSLQHHRGILVKRHRLLQTDTGEYRADSAELVRDGQADPGSKREKLWAVL